jgi:hypothetical protein
MADVVERVRALIARTSSPHEEEARTAAMIACRLIREHRLDVVPPGPAPSIGHEDFSARYERERRARAADPRRAAEERARQAAFDAWEERQRREREHERR